MTRQSDIMAFLKKVERDLDYLLNLDMDEVLETDLRDFYKKRVIDLERDNKLYPNVWSRLIHVKKRLK